MKGQCMRPNPRVFASRVGFIFLLCLAFTRCAHSVPNAERHTQLVIVGTNDFHGYLRPWEGKFGGDHVVSGGAEWFAGHVRVLEKKFGDRLVLLDAGDIFQGTMESNLFKGESTMAYYNLLPYRAAAVGNHEFDYGPIVKNNPDRLSAIRARIQQAKFPFVQANIFLRGTNNLWREKNLHPSVIVQAGGYKVGIMGLTTITTPVKTIPQNVSPLEFRALLPAALAEAQTLRREGADLVLLTTHEGGEKPGEPLYELLHALPKGTFDAVVSGHSHSEIHEFVNGVPVIQSKTRGVFFGRIDLFVDRTTRKVDASLTKIHDIHPICGVWFRNMESCDTKLARDLITAGKSKEADFVPVRKVIYEGEEVKADLPVRGALAPFFQKIDRISAEKLATAKRDFETFASGETEMGTLFTRAFHWKYPQAKVVYLNGGGIRRPFLKGDMKYSDLFEVHPFDNYVALVKITGKQLRSILEIGVSGAQKIPSVYGVRAEYRAGDRPEYWRDLNGDGRKDFWERNRLVSLTWDNGKPVKDTEEFWVATIDFLVNGGDNQDSVYDSIPANRKNYTEQPSRDVVAEYLRAHKGIALPTNDQARLKVLP